MSTNDDKRQTVSVSALIDYRLQQFEDNVDTSVPSDPVDSVLFDIFYILNAQQQVLDQMQKENKQFDSSIRDLYSNIYRITNVIGQLKRT